MAELCDVSHESVFRISRENRDTQLLRLSSRSNNTGRPRKLTSQQIRFLLRSLKSLCIEQGNFTAKHIMEEAGIRESEISVRSVTRYLNEHGYFYLQVRKKALMRKDDLKKRLDFATYCKNNYPANFWTDHVSFYLDGTGFAYKTNPLDQAKAPKGRTWRKKSEGLELGCTGKGHKEGTGSQVPRLMVAISYDKGVVVCEPHDKMCGTYFSDFIDRNFERMFAMADKQAVRIWVEDGDPSQNCTKAKEAMLRVFSQLLKILPRSPDLNPIENLFNVVSQTLKKDAIKQNITKETYEEFQQRVIQTMKSIPLEYINKLIASMYKRLNLVIVSKGNRIKY